MHTHPHLMEFLRLAYGCLACDGDIDPSEIACLRSVAVQMGQPFEEVDADLDAIRDAFASDAIQVIEETKQTLRQANLSHQDAVMLMDLLAQVIEADGKVHAHETLYVQDIVYDLGLDRKALQQEHPEWRVYLAPTLHNSERVRDLFRTAFEACQ